MSLYKKVRKRYGDYVEIPPTPGGAAASLIHQGVRTFTHAQIRDLPTAALTLIPAAGSTRVILPTYVVYRLSSFTASEGYGTINADSFLSHNGAPHLAEVWNSSLDSVSALSDWLTDFGGASYLQLLPTFDVFALDFANQYPDSYHEVEDVPLEVYIDNSGSGNFSGGHADNTLRASFVFYVHDPITGLFLTTDESGWDQESLTFG